MDFLSGIVFYAAAITCYCQAINFVASAIKFFAVIGFYCPALFFMPPQ
jgi:hypothetical protein